MKLLSSLSLFPLLLVSCSGSGGTGSAQRVRVTRGAIVRNATAVGRIEVVHEVPVKSLTGGILTKLFVKLGQHVEEGTPLAEVRPVLTERSIVAAERAIEFARKGEEAANEYLTGAHVASWMTRMVMGGKTIQRMHENAVLARTTAEEQLKLLKEGTATVENRELDFIVRAPVSGNVLDIRQREGSPVVPSSSYGSGTVFMTLADMNRLIFRGTVDEIDVGRLEEGKTAQIAVGALPGTNITGKLVEIALKGFEQNNAVSFPVRIEVDVPAGVVMRSGYSAVARVEIDRRDDVLTLPERVVRFHEGEAFVQLPATSGARQEHEIQTGLSDGLTVEVVAGLTEGQEVLERAYD